MALIKETKYSFFIPIEPVPKQYRNSGRGRIFLTKAAGDYQRHITEYMRSNILGETVDGYLWVYYVFLVKRKEGQKKFLYPNTKPDYDNLIKSTQDGIERAGLITNDSRIVDWGGRMLFSDSYDRVEGQSGTYVKIGLFKETPKAHEQGIQ